MTKPLLDETKDKHETYTSVQNGNLRFVVENLCDVKCVHHNGINSSLPLNRSKANWIDIRIQFIASSSIHFDTKSTWNCIHLKACPRQHWHTHTCPHTPQNGTFIILDLTIHKKWYYIHRGFEIHNCWHGYDMRSINRIFLTFFFSPSLTLARFFRSFSFTTAHLFLFAHRELLSLFIMLLDIPLYSAHTSAAVSYSCNSTQATIWIAFVIMCRPNGMNPSK